jgi:hypothetical protein
VSSGVPTLLATLVIAVPLALVASRLFAAAFDLPFQRHKSWSALLSAARARLRWAGVGVTRTRLAPVEDDGASIT